MKIKHFAIAVFVLLGAGAATVASSIVSSSGLAPWTSALGTSDVLMRVASREIRLSEVDERWRLDHPAEYMQAMQTQYESRKVALEAIVGELLVVEAAGARGETTERYVDAEVAQRADKVEDRDVDAFYTANAAELGGTIERYRDRIRKVLEDQARKRARQALTAELASAAGHSVDLLLDAPRQVMSVSSTDPVLGEAAAPVTIVAFSDFQCPFCARVEPTLKEIRKVYGDKVRIVWKDFPLTPIHPEAFKAAEAAHCAAEQGRYWEFHDRLFAHQEQMGTNVLKAHAGALGIDSATFAGCLDSSRYETRVREGMEAGRKLGIEATPTTFVNGRIVSGAQPVDVFARVINEELDRAGVRR